MRGLAEIMMPVRSQASRSAYRRVIRVEALTWLETCSQFLPWGTSTQLSRFDRCLHPNNFGAATAPVSLLLLLQDLPAPAPVLVETLHRVESETNPKDCGDQPQDCIWGEWPGPQHPYCLISHRAGR